MSFFDRFKSKKSNPDQKNSEDQGVESLEREAESDSE